MSAPNTTPGPWVAQTAFAETTETLQPSINGGGKSIAMVRRKRGIGLQEALANTHMIAASPDMYEALEEFVAALSSPRGFDEDYSEVLRYHGSEMAVAFDRANTALSRARGEVAK